MAPGLRVPGGYVIRKLDSSVRCSPGVFEKKLEDVAHEPEDSERHSCARFRVTYVRPLACQRALGL